ncbi:type II toxin-antitoxin system death-on-curing family toxin [Pedobacter panaciterrae]|uniref:type II toxin-antitoxin system death-on-curing family toxin n=1 Tax=Pedobacter panaciterrae TaxID=363849 RepID=UPI00155DC629|nr:type II toxin-antitoxin system death-on-curing family toxin [Pedobacter panaciterrae]NQX56864.1 type II toxin-antitoxin system death-on-curing family toxin [Pedobacter panaciterrae]
MVCNYFDLTHAKATHKFIIELSGGLLGERDIFLLESVLEHIQSDLYYPEFEDKLTHLVYSVNKGHAFNDGNKRTSIALGGYFLEINGLGILGSKFISEMENIAVHVADNRINKELLHEVICSILIEEDYNEELQIKLIDAISIPIQPEDEEDNMF